MKIHPIIPIDNEPRADGGVCHIDTCPRCGAERRTNSNGNYTATTGWYRLVPVEEMERRCRAEAARRFGQTHADCVTWWNVEPCAAEHAAAEIKAVMDDYAALAK